MNPIVNKFPKTRPVLAEKYIEIYKRHYHENRSGGSFFSRLSQKMESWMHKCASYEAKINQRILEIGAGTLNHVKYETFSIYDIVEPFTDLFEEQKEVKRIRNIYKEISQIPQEYKYDKIVSIATFEHITNLPAVIAKSTLHFSENCSLRVGIPNEGHLLWYLAYNLTTGLEFRIRYGLDYDVLMNYEHVNKADEIEELLSIFFNTISCRYFGFSKYLSLYRFYECKNPNSVNIKRYYDDTLKTE